MSIRNTIVYGLILFFTPVLLLGQVVLFRARVLGPSGFQLQERVCGYTGEPVPELGRTYYASLTWHLNQVSDELLEQCSSPPRTSQASPFPGDRPPNPCASMSHFQC